MLYLHDIMCNIAGIIAPYLLNLANRNDPISVPRPKVAKASTVVAGACRCCLRYCFKYNANVNYPLLRSLNFEVVA
jgi:hypothetical protein